MPCLHPRRVALHDSLFSFLSLSTHPLSLSPRSVHILPLFLSPFPLSRASSLDLPSLSSSFLLFSSRVAENKRKSARQSEKKKRRDRKRDVFLVVNSSTAARHVVVFFHPVCPVFFSFPSRKCRRLRGRFRLLFAPWFSNEGRRVGSSTDEARLNASFTINSPWNVRKGERERQRETQTESPRISGFFVFLFVRIYVKFIIRV